MSQVWVPGEQWLNASYIADVLTHPFDFAIVQLAPLGGLSFLYASFSLLTISYTYMHYKSALAAGVVALTLSALGVMIPELNMLGFVLMVLGFTAVMARVLRKVIG